MADRIPEEVLNAAHLKWCRQVASLVISAMAETGISYETMEQRLGWKRGHAKRWINKFIEGDTNEGRAITDLATAMGLEISMTMRQLQPLADEAAEHSVSNPS